MAKTIKTKRVFIYLAYLGVKNTPPADFVSGEEMDTMFEDVIPEFMEKVLEFKTFDDEMKEVNTQYSLENIKEEVANKKLKDLVVGKRKIEMGVGEETVEVTLENDPFNQFFQMFERAGKTWFNIAENYYEFRKSLNETNKQKKDKKEE